MPGKFDDISKTASSVLGDDFQCKDVQLKMKQKSNFAGATSEATVNLNPATETKLNFKFPKIAFLDGFCIDKFELDKAGKGKLECSLDKALHSVDGLKVEVKSDVGFGTGVPSPSGLSYGATYTGVKDASVKLETKQDNLADPTIEVLYGTGPAVVGAKLAGLSKGLCPQMGVNFASGDMFASIIAKDQFSSFTAHGLYKVSGDISAAATCTYGLKDGKLAWAAGGSYKVNADITAKAKLDSKQAFSLAFKTDLAKGTGFVGGVGYDLNTSALTWGAKVSVE